MDSGWAAQNLTHGNGVAGGTTDLAVVSLPLGGWIEGGGGEVGTAGTAPPPPPAPPLKGEGSRAWCPPDLSHPPVSCEHCSHLWCLLLSAISPTVMAGLDPATQPGFPPSAHSAGPRVKPGDDGGEIWAAGESWAADHLRASASTYWAMPLPKDQSARVTSTRLMKTSSRRRPSRALRPSATAL